MTKATALLLSVGFVVLLILVLLRVFIGNGDDFPLVRSAEITAPEGTQVFARLPGENERLLAHVGGAPLVLEVAVGASLTLRHAKNEKTFPPEAWENGKITWRPHPRPLRTVAVNINAVPWAKVFIKRPVDERFIVLPNIESNITPIRGGLEVPIGTAIRMVYEDKEKTFAYETWKTSKTISHDFLNP